MAGGAVMMGSDVNGAVTMPSRGTGRGEKGHVAGMPVISIPTG